ncbi:L-type lectin-domain containing receptor kinase IX.1-like [Quercus lobata]|uniref:non-specific serine/threonine protein kinase n=1 Tax=Quercus lobata TaxID=97700 RepID=A0A7N2L6Y6_QUELO|nr:L-type lectin-domain containing receptor kinase IX.1-like [Quercus lobata]
MALSNTLPSCLFQPQKLQSLLFFFLLLLPPVLSISFNLTSFNDTYINRTGDAVINSYRQIEVTKDTLKENITESVGRATYKEPVRLWENRTGRLTDFTTHFSFKIEATSPNAEWSADGLAFFITANGSNVPYNKTKGGALGLLDFALDNSTQNEIVAVEFDTFKNDFDPSANHVGIDVNSVKSKANVSWPRSIISNGEIVNAWVSYNSTTQNLSVFLTYAINSVSKTTSLFHIVNLKDVLPEWVSVGFSAATGAGTEFHTILSWSFSSTLEVEDGSRKNNLGLGIGLAVSSAVVCCALGVIWFIFRRRRASRNTEDLGDDDNMDIEFEKGTGPRRFTYRELLNATNNFTEQGKLGEGGFGGVYKGLLSESNIEVAVKRVSRGSKQGKKEYMSEVKIISRLRHKNLVQLIGWCHEQRELLLVYEYMPNKSLDSHLFGAEIVLTWPIRYKIAQGLASALLYLHEGWEQCVVHRDIKSSNIMLDSNFNAKLGDFGLARLVDPELGSQTTVLAGTMGYLAPECVTTGRASKESDVYSFGVVSLEIACGRKPVEPQAEPSKVRLVEWVWDLYGKDQLLEAVDKGLGMEFDKEQIESLMVVGLWCCHPDPTIRPSIRQVIHVLNFEAPLPNLPSKFPIPIYFGSSMHLCEFSNTSTLPTVSEDQTQFSGSSCSTNSSMLAGSSKPLLNLGKADVELTSITH